MRILTICQYYYPEPFRINDICEALVERGHEVTVLTGLPNYPGGKVLPQYRFGRMRSEITNGVSIHRCYEIGRGRNKISLFANYVSFAISSMVKALLVRDEFDVIFVYQLSPVTMCLPAIVYKWRTKKKIALYCLDLWPESLVAGGVNKGTLVYSVFLFLSRWIYQSVDSILVTSKMFTEYFSDVIGIDATKVKHVPQHAEDLFLAEHDVPCDRMSVNFVFAGNVGEMQSVETILKAAHIVRDIELMIHVVGDGSRLERCKRLATEMNLNNVKFHGRRPLSEMPFYYAMADAMLITLWDNGATSFTLPGKVQSYMAAGKPILGAVNGEARRVIEDADCGLCCGAEDHVGLARIIIEFCRSSNKKKMGINSRHYYLKHYSKDQFIDSLIAELSSLEAH